MTCQQLTGEDSYQIAVMGVQGTCVEIVSDVPLSSEESVWVLISFWTVKGLNIILVRVVRAPLQAPFKIYNQVTDFCGPPPVLDMPGFFDLELSPSQHVALDITINSDELDMLCMEDGMVVNGKFWGKLDIVHSGETHSLEFNDTWLPPGEDYTPKVIDSCVMSKLAVATKLTTTKCHLTILTPGQHYCEVVLIFSSLWKLGVA